MNAVWNTGTERRYVGNRLMEPGDIVVFPEGALPPGYVFGDEDGGGGDEF